MNNRKGFSLVELLIAIAIFSIISFAFFTMLSRGSQRYSTDNQIADLQNEAQVAINQVENIIVNTDSAIAGGTDYFKVENKDGTVYEFTKSAVESRVYGYQMLMTKYEGSNLLAENVPIAQYIASFSLDTSSLNTNDTVKLTVEMTDGSKEYESYKEIYLRNAIGTGGGTGGNLIVSGEYDEMLVADRYGTYDLKALYSTCKDFSIDAQLTDKVTNTSSYYNINDNIISPNASLNVAFDKECGFFVHCKKLSGYEDDGTAKYADYTILVKTKKVKIGNNNAVLDQVVYSLAPYSLTQLSFIDTDGICWSSMPDDAYTVKAYFYTAKTDETQIYLINNGNAFLLNNLETGDTSYSGLSQKNVTIFDGTYNDDNKKFRLDYDIAADKRTGKLVFARTGPGDNLSRYSSMLSNGTCEVYLHWDFEFKNVAQTYSVDSFINLSGSSYLPSDDVTPPTDPYSSSSNEENGTPASSPLVTDPVDDDPDLTWIQVTGYSVGTQLTLPDGKTVKKIRITCDLGSGGYCQMYVGNWNESVQCAWQSGTHVFEWTPNAAYNVFTIANTGVEISKVEIVME